MADDPDKARVGKVEKEGSRLAGLQAQQQAQAGRQAPPKWDTKIEKLTIGSLDNAQLTVVAQYNPNTLQFEKQIAWQKPERLAGQNAKQSHKQDEVEITSKPTRSVTLELLFDGFEEHRSVQPLIEMLEEMSSVREPGSKVAALRRAHHCVVIWGPSSARQFRCVIDSLTTKLTMFAPNGEPLRATCTMKLTEVTVLEKDG